MQICELCVIHPLACCACVFWVFPMLNCGRAGKLFPVSEGFILWSNSPVIHSERETKTKRQEVGAFKTPRPQSFTPDSPSGDQCSCLIQQSPAFSLLPWDLSERLSSKLCWLLYHKHTVFIMLTLLWIKNSLFF